MATPPGLTTFMHAERIQESGGNYAAVNPNSGAAGAYQFTFGTWQYALRLAGLSHTSYYLVSANEAPPGIQDAAAAALMSAYYYQFSQSWYNVAEAWYGGPGAVGHPDWGGGPGYPNVGQYAAQVIATYNRLGGAASSPPPPSLGSPFAPGFETGLYAYYIDVIEPMGKTWRQFSRPLPAAFWSRPWAA